MFGLSTAVTPLGRADVTVRVGVPVKPDRSHVSSSIEEAYPGAIHVRGFVVDIISPGAST